MPEEKNFSAELNRLFRENGLGHLLNRRKAEQLEALTRRLLEENEKYNLTAITDPTAIILQHYVDSVLLAQLLPKGASLLDVGCGAGFPSLPLAICREDLRITALDSTARRVQYVADTATLLDLQMDTVVMRAEDAGRDKRYRDSFDFVTARAVAELRVLCELCLPCVKPRGQLLAMKGRNAHNELKTAARAIAILGGRAVGCEEWTIRGGEEPVSHCVLRIGKVQPTPAAYPRAFAQITKKPL